MRHGEYVGGDMTAFLALERLEPCADCKHPMGEHDDDDRCPCGCGFFQHTPDDFDNFDRPLPKLSGDPYLRVGDADVGLNHLSDPFPCEYADCLYPDCDCNPPPTGAP